MFTLTKEAAIQKTCPKTGLARVNERGEYFGRRAESSGWMI